MFNLAKHKISIKYLYSRTNLHKINKKKTHFHIDQKDVLTHYICARLLQQ